MPRKSKRNISETEITHLDKEESVGGNTDSQPDDEELQADAAMANLQTTLQELGVL